MSRNYWELLNSRISQGTNLCVGIDPVIDKVPNRLRDRYDNGPTSILQFAYKIVDAASDHAAAFKINLGFFMRWGHPGIGALHGLVDYLHVHHPDVPVILDCKVGDIGDTNAMYAQAYFDKLGADAITVHPYLGSQAMQPFLERTDKGIYVLCRTSNPGADEVQSLPVGMVSTLPLYVRIAGLVEQIWNTNRNCGLVTGATYPREIGVIRSWFSDIPLLIPGIGKQGGDLEAAVTAAMGPEGNAPFLINVSSAICHASSGNDFAEAAAAKAKFYRDEINRVRGTKEVAR